MQPIRYKTNKKKIAILLVIFIIATFLSAIAAYFAPGLLNRVVGVLPVLVIVLVYIVLAVSIIGLIAGIIRLLSNRFDLILTEQGIQHNAEFGVGKMILWKDIQRISIETNGLNKGIAVFLINPQDYIDSFNGLKKQGVGLLNLKYGTPCVINVQALHGNEEEILAAMQQFISHQRT
jgi:hypothetical protein